MKGDGDLRMLGASDGFAHALIDVRGFIRRLTYYPINARYSRKIKNRDAILAPLRELEQIIVKKHAETRAAYLKTTEQDQE